MMQNRIVTPRNVVSNIFQSDGGFSKSKPVTFNTFEREINTLPDYRKFNPVAKEKNDSSGPSKISISNLHAQITDADIKLLFEDFGRMKSSTVLFDYKGRSLGRAEVVFKRRTDAIKAIEKYNGTPLDGLPMDIKIVEEYSVVQNTVAIKITTATQSIQQRLGQAKRKIDNASKNVKQRLGHIRRKNDTSQSSRQTERITKIHSQRIKHEKFNEKGGLKKQSKGPILTVESLNAELDEYFKFSALNN